MVNVTKTKSLLIASAIVLAFVGFSTACDEDNTDRKQLYSPTEIEENYSLLGTSWKFIGLIEDDQLILPPENTTTTLCFKYDTLINATKMEGCMPINWYQIVYSIDENNRFTYWIPSGHTKMGGSPDLMKFEGLYWDRLYSSVYSFKLIRVGDIEQLKLFYSKIWHYDTEGYMLFNRTEENICE